MASAYYHADWTSTFFIIDKISLMKQKYVAIKFFEGAENFHGISQTTAIQCITVIKMFLNHV